MKRKMSVNNVRILYYLKSKVHGFFPCLYVDFECVLCSFNSDAKKVHPSKMIESHICTGCRVGAGGSPAP